MTKLVSDLKKAPSKETLGKVAELLDRNGIDLDMVGQIIKVSAYQTLMKDKNGEGEVYDQVAIQFSPSWETGPEWPVVQPAPKVKMPQVKIKPQKKREWGNLAVILPDIQIGYFRLADDTLEPTHDESALSLALQLLTDEQPDEVILLGDNLDLPEMSKYRFTPAFERTTQAAIDRAGLLVAQLRAAVPHARIRWIAGNHEERLVNYILDNAKASFGLKRANTPKSWPVMSLPHLCWFDDYDVEYVPGYPANNLWLNERRKIIPGTVVKSRGSTSHKYLDQEKVSVIYGHIHRREWNERTRDDWDGPKTIMAASPGCLARVDGVVPSTKGGTDLDGRPLTNTEDWQQGLAFVHFETDGDHRFFYEQVPIHNGACMYHGKLYEYGKDDGS